MICIFIMNWSYILGRNGEIKINDILVSIKMSLPIEYYEKCIVVPYIGNGGLRERKDF